VFEVVVFYLFIYLLTVIFLKNKFKKNINYSFFKKDFKQEFRANYGMLIKQT
jgi:hypothetical protein